MPALVLEKGLLDVSILLSLCGVGLLGLVGGRFNLFDTDGATTDAILDSMEQGIVILNADEEITNFNLAAADVFPDLDDNVGEPVDAAYPELREAAASDDAFSGAELAEGMTRRYFDVTWRDIDSTPEGDAAGCLILLQDVTPQRRREQTLQSLQRITYELMQVQNVADVATIARNAINGKFNQVDGGILVKDTVDVGDEETLVDSSESDYFLAGDSTLPIDGPFKTVLETGQSQTLAKASTREAFVTVTQDLGLTRAKWVRLHSLGGHGVLILASRTPRQIDSIGEDYVTILTQSLQATLERLDRDELLRERNRQIKFFNGMLRHDLLNKLGVIADQTTFLKRVLDDSALTDRVEDYITRIENSASQALSVTEEVRQISKTVTDTTGKEIETLELTDVIGDKVAAVNPGPHVTITTALPNGKLFVRANPLVGQIIENLMMNAIEHGGDDITIQVEAERKDSVVEVRIADDGPGIPDDKKESVFNEGVTENGSESSGFGLYFVKTMMEQFGGDVWFEDAPGEDGGTVAVLQFKRATSR